MPYFSIIIPTYNRSRFLINAIDSIRKQTFVDWELIIVDDGSTDDTAEKVKSIKDTRIRYVYQENAERSAARNNGVRNSRGSFIAFLDSDDYLLPEYLQDLRNSIEKNENKPCLYISKVMVQKDNRIELLYDIFPHSENIVKYFFTQFEVIQVSQITIPKDILKDNSFDERFSLWEDTHLYLRLLCQYPYINCDINGVVLNKHEESSVAKGMKFVKLADLNKYVCAIKDLRANYWSLFEKYIDSKDITNYINAKMNMYFYQARRNNQFGLAAKILIKMLRNNFSIQNAIYLVKLPVLYFITLTYRR